MTWRTSSARAAANSSASASALSWTSGSLRMSRTRSPAAVPPGSRTATAPSPSASASRAACVLLPERSMPSSVTNRPGTSTRGRWPAARRRPAPRRGPRAGAARPPTRWRPCRRGRSARASPGRRRCGRPRPRSAPGRPGAGAQVGLHVVARLAQDRADHLEHGRALAAADVVGGRGRLARLQVLGHGHVRVGQVDHVHVVAHARAVGRVVVGAEDQRRLPRDSARRTLGTGCAGCGRPTRPARIRPR